MAKIFKAFYCDICGKTVDQEHSYYTEVLSLIDSRINERKERIFLYKDCGDKVDEYINRLKGESKNDFNRQGNY